MAVTIDFNLKAVDNLSKSLDKISKEIGKTVQSIKSLNNSMSNAVSKTNASLKETSKSLSKSTQSIQTMEKDTKALSTNLLALGNVAKTVFAIFATGFLRNENFINDFIQLFKDGVKLILEEGKKLAGLFINLGRAIKNGSSLGIVKALRDIDSQVTETFENVVSKGAEVKDVFGGDFISSDVFSIMDLFKQRIKSEVVDGMTEAAKSVAVFGAVSTPVLVAATGNQTKALQFLGASIRETRSSLSFFSEVVKKGAAVLPKLGTKLLLANRNFFGLVENVALAGAGFTALSQVLLESDSQFGRVAGRISFIAGIALVSLSAALTKTVLLIGDLANQLGTKLVVVFKRASDSFIDFDKKVFVFTRTIEGFSRVFGDSVGTIEGWESTIKGLVKSTGATEKALRSASSEIIATTSQMGFNAKQMKKLLKIANDYAAQIGGDTVQSTIDFISALNGSSQSVIKYGVKLTAASVQQKLYKSGIDRTFSSLSESEKIQARYNALLTQYAPIAGVAAAVSNTLAGSEKRLKNNLLAINQEFGRGAALVESNNVAIFALSNAIDILNPKVFATAGFVGALGARVLQIGGLFLKWSFTIFAVIKAFTLLKVFLASDLAATLFARSIPVINLSLIQLAGTAGITATSLTTVSGIFRGLAASIVFQSKFIIASLLGIEISAVSLAGVMGGIFTRSLVLAKLAVLGFSKGLRVLLVNPVASKILIIVGAVILLVKGFQEIEKRTGAVSTLWKAVTSVFASTSPVLEPLTDLVGRFFKVIATSTEKVLGFFIVKLTSVLELALFIVKKNPFGTFSKQVVAEASKASDALEQFNLDMVTAKLRITQLKPPSRGIAAGMEDIAKVDLAKVISSLEDLREALKNVGVSELKQIKDLRDQRLKLIQDGFDARKLSAIEASQLEIKTELAFNESLKPILDQRRKLFEAAQKKAAPGIAAGLSLISPVAPNAGSSLAGPSAGGVAPGQSAFDAAAGAVGQAAGETSAAAFETGMKGAIAKIANSFAANLGKGAEGARAFLADAAGTVVEKFLPGAGAAVTSIVTLLSKGPDFVRQQILAFTGAIPGLIENIIESLPVLIESLIVGLLQAFDRILSRVDVIINAFVVGITNAIPSIVQALATHLPFIAIQLALLMPLVAVEFGLALIRTIPEYVSGVVNGIVNGLKGAIGKVTGGEGSAVGKVGGFFKGIGKTLGFAEGGKIQKVPSGFSNDSALVRAGSGELIVSRDTTNKLEDFLSNPDGGSGSSAGVEILLNQILGALGSKQPLTVNVQLNDETLASAIFDLTRTNARLVG